ncbi:MAG: type I restriction endonuclease subunit R, partial [Terricaulis sp.]
MTGGPPDDFTYPTPSAGQYGIRGFSEGELVQGAAIELLGAHGWAHKDLRDETFGADSAEGRVSARDPILAHRLNAALRALNPDLPQQALDLAFEELARPRSALAPIAANREALALLRDGVSVKFRDGDEDRTEWVRVIDWRNPSANDFLFATEVWFEGELYRRRADGIGFVNGLPLLFAEFKAIGRPLKDAYDDNLRAYRTDVSQSFWFNAAVLLSNGVTARLGAAEAPFERFAEWKRANEEDAPGRADLATILAAIGPKPRFLDLVENFLLFQEERNGLVKKVAQNHQVLGVNRAVAAVRELAENRGRLGVFWHTQGSGKSLSMVAFARKVLRTEPGNWTFLIVTDRAELDQQIAETFDQCGELGKALDEVQAQTREHLKALLRGNERYIFTLIQKFGTAQGEVFPELSDRSDIIVIADEAHRSQYDLFAANMRRALPNAAFIGFTGTPLMAGEEATKQVFGDYVSIYNFAQSVEDGATVPLYYENRIPEVQIDNPDFAEQLGEIVDNADLNEEAEALLAQNLGQMYQVITRDDRLDKIAHDLVRHFIARGYRGKAMFVAIDKATAVRMHDKVRAAWEAEIAARAAALPSAAPEQREAFEAALSWMRETDMAVVVSQSQNEIADLAERGLDMRRHRERLAREKLDERFKDAGDPLRLVFVCAMWITGFDVPTCSTIYLDKPMRNHTLMQTIARANRTAPGKRSGLIVDYVGVFRNLQRALAIYAQPATEGAAPIEDKAALVERLAAAIAEANQFCERREVALATILTASVPDRLSRIALAVERLMGPDAEITAFLRLAGETWSLFKSVLPDPRADAHRQEAVVLRALADAVRAQIERPNVSEVARDIEALLDDSIAGISIAAPIRAADDITGLIDLSKIDFDRLRARFNQGPPRTQARQLRRAVENRIAAMVRANPTRRDLVQRLEELVARYNSGSIEAERLFEDLLTLLRDLSEEDQRSVRENLSEEELAIFDILTKPDLELTDPERDLVKRIARDLLGSVKHECE